MSLSASVVQLVHYGLKTKDSNKSFLCMVKKKANILTVLRPLLFSLLPDVQTLTFKLLAKVFAFVCGRDYKGM